MMLASISSCRIGNLSSNNRLYIFFLAFDTLFSQASIISAAFISCERFYAMYWPFKHRTLSTRTYRVLIIIVWIITLFISAIWTGSNLLLSTKHTMFVWGLYTLILVLIMCGCYMGIWRKFQSGSVATSHQQNRDLQNKRLTKTLLFVSGLSLLAWLPLIKLLDICLSFTNTIQILFHGKPYKLLQLFCQSGCLCITNCRVSTSSNYTLFSRKRASDEHVTC